MNWLEGKQKTLWIISGIALLLIVIIAVGTGGDNAATQPASSEQQSVAEQQNKQKDLSALDGFKLTSNVSEGIYTYTTEQDNGDYSVSLGVEQNLLDAHTDNYPLKRNENAYNSVSVDYGYNGAMGG